MRNFSIVMVASLCLGMSIASGVRAQSIDWRAVRKQLRTQQKMERNALKTQQGNIKRSWKQLQVSKPIRDQAKHQMQRERRDLNQRQKDAMQDLKDRQKVLKQYQKIYG